MPTPLPRQQHTSTFGNETQEPHGAGRSSDQPPVAQMSDKDRFGLAGLLGMIHSENPDVSSLAIGQDLMSLGLDINQPEYAFSTRNLIYFSFG